MHNRIIEIMESRNGEDIFLLINILINRGYNIRKIRNFLTRICNRCKGKILVLGQHNSHISLYSLPNADSFGYRCFFRYDLNEKDN